MFRALDLFCGAGGATRGLQMTGFHVTGVDINPQPRYCGDAFVQGDIAKMHAVHLFPFDFVWASPPCQAHTTLKAMHNAKRHADMIATTRALLVASGKPYVIENVSGAPLQSPFILCGTMFCLGTKCGAVLHRHRLFETNFCVSSPRCTHGDEPVVGVYGGHYRNRKRKAGLNREAKDFTAADGKRAMGIDWMTGKELSQAIPPAYSEFIARQWLATRVPSELHGIQK
jgi:DNA (cytosine-5)-methyltransferase 1